MTKRQLKAAVAAARAGKRRGRFSAELKSAVVEYGGARRTAGAAWSEIADELGLGENQLSGWCRGGRGAPRAGLREVAVVPDAIAPGAPLELALPGGAVVTGLDVDTLAAVLRALR